MVLDTLLSSHESSDSSYTYSDESDSENSHAEPHNLAPDAARARFSNVQHTISASIFAQWPDSATWPPAGQNALKFEVRAIEYLKKSSGWGANFKKRNAPKIK